MIFLLVRALPYVIPLFYLVLLRVVFYFPNYWIWIVLVSVVSLLLWFALLKSRDTSKSLLPSFAYALIFLIAGFSYLMILENNWIINGFSVGWSFIFWLYLEAVFHDFYKTGKTYILNLQNVSLYSNILVIFFLSASLSNFSIFLNWSKTWILVFLLLVYFALLYSVFLFQGWEIKKAQVFSFILSLVMIEFTAVIMLLPSSFYIIASLSAGLYYFLSGVSILWMRQSLDKIALAKYLGFSLFFAAIVMGSANWL